MPKKKAPPKLGPATTVLVRATENVLTDATLSPAQRAVGGLLGMVGAVVIGIVENASQPVATTASTTKESAPTRTRDMGWIQREPQKPKELCDENVPSGAEAKRR